MAEHLFSWAKSKSLFFSKWGVFVVGVLVVAGGWWFLRPSTAEQATIVLEPKAFVQEVSVSGKVTPTREVALGFSEGGRVAGVYVSVGQAVGQGATLAAVENADLRAAVLQRQAAQGTQEVKLAALQSGTRPEEVSIAEATVAHDRTALVDELQDAYRAAEAAVHNTLDQFINNGRTNPSITLVVSDSNLKNKVENERLAAESSLAVWAGVLSLSADGDLSSALAQGRGYLAGVAGLLSDANAALNRAVPSSSASQATIDTYISATATARTNVNAATAAVNAAASALDQSVKNLALKRAGSTPGDIATQEAQVKAARADVAAAQAELGKTFITAPFSGVITVVDAKVGKIVSPNTPEISIISGGVFQIESYVPEINVALLRRGDKAQVTLDAYGDNTFFDATVASIDPADTVRDGVSTYRAVLQFDRPDTRIKAGMTANIVITTDTKASVLSVPQGLVQYRGAKSYVRVLVGGAVQEREVTLGGVSSLGEVEVLSGLAAGDIVVATLP
ncbi:MAG: efflux RND transporter periplasmic adaptor subunit [Patescibacteria group bacterium]